MVGVIAEARLCDGARALIAPLLAGNSLANAGVWADGIRDDPAWAHTRAWHFVNAGDREDLAEVVAGSADNVVAAIGQAERDLAQPDLPRERRAQALRFLVHFVADVHQPLHVGRAGDRGGNDIEVGWGNERISLHELWDARAVLRAEGLSTRDLAAALGALALGQDTRWQASTPLDWAEESRSYRPLVYGLPQGRSRRVQLDAGYLALARNVIGLRLAQAGVRVAGRLNHLGCTGAVAVPSAPSR